MKNLKNICLLLVLALLLGSCKDFLDREPFDKLVPASFFNTETDLSLYSNSFYQDFVPSALSIVQEDEMGDFTSKTNSPTFIAGNFSAVDQGRWSWFKLRNINYFLEHYNNPAIPEEARLHYAGIARFFRAYFYFDMVKTYGDVPWYGKTMAPNDADLYKDRDARTLVMDSVLADLDFAIANIRVPKDPSSTMITKWVALGLKSRICLFEGTFRKYHIELKLATTADTWLQESAKASKEIIDGQQYTLHSTGNANKDYRALFTAEAPVVSEVMWSNVYNNALKRWHEVTWKFNSATFGSRWGLNKQFVNTYLQVDGTRFTDKANYDEKLFVEEMKNRDPRLGQSIRSLGYTRTDGSAAPPNFGYTFTGYHLLKFSLDEKRLDGLGESYNSVTMMRYAEILLNYAEASAELGLMNTALWDQTIGALRKRAGVAADEPKAADPYLQAVYFPEIGDKHLLEVRRERGIELLYEGFRYRDLLRWKKGKLLEMEWRGIYVPGLNIEMDLDGNGSPDVSFVNAIPAQTTANVVYYVVDGTAAKLSQGTKGHLIWRADENREFSDKKYYRPISNADLVDNRNLTQNPGW